MSKVKQNMKLKRTQKLITEELKEKLIKNNKKVGSDEELEIKPVVRIFSPWSHCHFLISDYNPDDDVYFGLADLGLGFPELGYIDLKEIEFMEFTDLHVPFFERDITFKADKTISQYAEIARKTGRIIL